MFFFFYFEHEALSLGVTATVSHCSVHVTDCACFSIN